MEKFKKDNIFYQIIELSENIQKDKTILSKNDMEFISIDANKLNLEEIKKNEQEEFQHRQIYENEKKLKYMNELYENDILCNLFDMLNKEEQLRKLFFRDKDENLHKFEEKVLKYFLDEINNISGFTKIKNKHLIMSYKLEENKTITLKFEKEFDIPFEHFISLIYETSFFPKWFPFCIQSDTLKQPDKAKKLVYIVSDFPLLSNRDFLVYGFGVNRLKENRSILILVKSIEENSDVFNELLKKKENKNYVRAVIHIFGYEITLINRNKFICKGLLNVDPKINFIPQSLINFVGKKVYNINIVCRKFIY